MSNHMFNFIFKLSQYPVLSSICWYVYFKVIFKKTWFCKVNFRLWKISRNGDRISISKFPKQLYFSASYFPISHETLDQNIYWPYYGIIIESSKFLSKCPCSLFGLLGLFFPADFPNETHFLKIGIHSIQDWTTTSRHGVARKRSTKRLKHTENLFRKDLQLISVC